MNEMNDNKNIMSPGEKAIVSYDAPFLNSDCVFVEYYDVIKSPWFVLLHYIHDNEALQELFDITEVYDASIEELYEWYINREERNIFLNFPLKEGVFEEIFESNEEAYYIWVTDFLNSELEKIHQCVSADTSLNFAKAMTFLDGSTITKRIYVYTELYNSAVEEELQIKYGQKVQYVYGDFKDVIEKNDIDANSTFVFSDIEKVLSLKECGILEYSSIVIADRYAYNYTKNNDPIVDVDELAENTIFKLSYFDNLTSYEEEDE